MRLLVTLLIIAGLSSLVHAQNNYTQAIQQGDAALRRGEYKTAIKKYFAAEAIDPSRKAVVQRKVEVVFDKIEALRVEAERAKKAAQEALAQVKEEQEKTAQALEKANKLINAFYFYADRFTLAYKDNLYYFIDKSGNRVEKLGYWEKIGQFDADGFALGLPLELDTFSTLYPETYEEHFQIIRKSTNDYYILDTTGKKYLCIPENPEKDIDITAVVQRNKQLKTFPENILDKPNLELLWLNGNELEQLPAQIGKLQNLKLLDLSNNKITTLPPEIWNLENLKTLNLGNNNLADLPKEIGNLKNLEQLDLSGTLISTFPEELGNLKRLKMLNVATGIFPLQNLATIEQLLPDCQIITDFDAGMMSIGLEEISHDYPQAYYYQKKVVDEYSTIDRHWFRLSWLALFVNKPEEAIKAAKKTLELNAQSQSVESNLALGYLLNNQWPEAEKIYLKWKGKSFPNDKRTCDAIFLKDIADLETAGINHPDFEKVRHLLKN